MQKIHNKCEIVAEYWSIVQNYGPASRGLVISSPILEEKSAFTHYYWGKHDLFFLKII